MAITYKKTTNITLFSIKIISIISDNLHKSGKSNKKNNGNNSNKGKKNNNSNKKYVVAKTDRKFKSVPQNIITMLKIL